MQCSKIRGVLQVVGFHCHFAMFLCMEFIVRGFSHDSVLLLYYTVTLENHKDICSVFLPLLICFC